MILTHYVIKLAEGLGLSIPELCAESGLNPEEIGDKNVRVSTPTFQALVRAIIRRTGNEHFLLQPLNPDLASFDNPLWYYFYNAVNLREALNRGERAYRFLSDLYYPSLVEFDQEAEVRWECRSDQETMDQQVDWMLSGWWGMLILYAGDHIKLKAVRLAKASPDRVKAYGQFYNVPIEVGSSKDALVFERSMMDLPNARMEVDPNLDRLLSRYIWEVVPDPLSKRNISQEMFDAVQHQFLHGAPTLESVAKRMNMSERTMQRRLTELGTSFSDFVRSVRQQLSKSYLRQDDLAITEIAFMLGFSDSNSFTKSFRQWYDQTPSQFRRSLKS